MKQMKRMKRLTIAVSVAASMWACDGSSPTSPTAPPLARYTLSGVVSEVTPTGQAPVQGARVESSNPRRAATTDQTGSYRIDGVYAGPNSVRVSTEAHETVSRDVTIAGDTRLDIQVIQRATYTLSGVVSEMTSTGQVPVEGVQVDEGYFHAQVKTDTNGFYSFTGPYGTDIRNFVLFTKEGYLTATSEVAINGNTRLDVQLVRR